MLEPVGVFRWWSERECFFATKLWLDKKELLKRSNFYFSDSLFPDFKISASVFFLISSSFSLVFLPSLLRGDFL